MTAFVESHAFHWNVLNATTRFETHSLGTPREFASTSAVAIDMTDKAGWKTTLFLAASDQRPLGMTILPSGRTTAIVTYFQDWISIDGARAFSRALIVDEDDIYVYSFVHIGFDKLSDEKFDLSQGT